jgi:hypothetical protein
LTKEKLTSLIKRLEKLANKLDADPNIDVSAKSADEEATEVPKVEEMITTAPTKKSTTLKMRGLCFCINCDFSRAFDKCF